MIIYSKNVDIDKVISLKDNPDALVEYVESILPPNYKKHETLTSNQKYYVVSKVLDTALSKEEKKAISDILLRKIKTVGYIDSFIELSEIERFVDRNRLNEMIRKGLLK